MPVPPPGQPSRALLGLGLLVAVVLGLHLLGHPALAPPDLTAPSTWLDWVGSRSPTMAAMALVRLVAIALAWYLLAVTVLQVLVILTDSTALATAVRLVTTPACRHVATVVLGAGVLAATPLVTPTSNRPAVAAAAPAGLARPTRPVAVPGAVPDPQHRPVPVASPGASSTRAPRLQRVDAPRLRRVEPSDRADEVDGATDVPSPDQAGAPTPEPTPEPSPEPTPVTGHDPPGDVGAEAPDDESTGRMADSTTWTVVAGDHFWGVAEREVTRVLGRSPTEHEVATWWRELVAVNSDRLVDPGNPDLILPGQVMRWPDTPVRGHG